MTAFSLKTSLVAASSLLALGLAACKEDYGNQTLALPDPTPAAFLSAPMGLPYAEPAPVSWYAPDQGYQWPERAYGLQQAFYETPPDYAFDYGGMRPWAWETADDWAMYAEPWDDGYRYYYYEPEAAYPYFVRDGQYGYGFDPTGMLVALLDASGNYLPQEQLYGVAPLAGRYYLHGRDLRNAAIQATPIPVVEDVWIQRAPLLLASTDPWLRAAREDDDWRAFRDRTGERELKRFLKEEKRREKEARKWARELRRDDDFARRYAAAAAVEPRIYPEAAQAEDRRWDSRHRAAERQREDRRKFAEQVREPRQKDQEQARKFAERQREARQKDWEQDRKFAERQRGDRAKAVDEARKQERRWAEANARQATAVEGRREDRGERKAERQGGGDDRGGKGREGKDGGDKGRGEGKGGGKKD